MNKVIIIGNIATDIEARTTQSGISNATFRVAVRRKYANQEGQHESDFFSVVAWRKTADFCVKYLAKGNRVAVEGSLQTRSYDAQDGTKRYVTEIIAESVEGLERPSEGRREAPAQDNNDFTEVENDDELPF